MKMNSILQKIKLGPRVTLNQLINQTKKDKIVQSPNIYNKSFKFNTKQGIQVKEPFYIDRFKHSLHHGEHSQQKCLACQYAKLKQLQFEYKKKDHYSNLSNKVKLNKQNCFPIRTLRNSQQNISQILKPYNNRYRASEGAQEAEEQQQANLKILQKCIQQKLKQLDQNFKQKFRKQIKKDCDSTEIINKFSHYLLNSNRNSGVWSIIKNVETLDIKKLITKQSFINIIKNQQIPPLIYSHLRKTKFNRNITNFQNSATQLSEKANLKTLKLLQSQPKVKRRSKVIEIIKKKVKILQSEEENLKTQSEAQSICSSYLNNIQNSLTGEIKDKLSKVARKQYKKFKVAINSMDDFIHVQLQQYPTIHEQISKKVQIAADWMKISILHNDKFEEDKNKRLDKLIKSAKQNKPGQKSNNISRKSNDKTHALSKFDNQQQQPNSDNSSSIQQLNNNTEKRQKSQNSKEQQKINIIIKNQKNSKLLNPFKISLNRQTNIQQHAGKLTQQKQFHRNNQQQIVHVFKKSDIKTRKSKMSFLKHQKLQNQQYYFQEQEQEYQQNKKQQIFQKSLNQNRKFCDNCQQSIKQSIKYQIKYSQQVKPKISYQNKQPQKFKHEHCRKLLRRIKAAQLLKHNQQLILNVQNSLRQLNLSICIINQSDCVLTQKKKIRFLRQLIRIRQISGDLQHTIRNQILQYLLVYEQNCQILIQKYTNQQHIQNKVLMQIKNILGKQCLKNKLLFYQLNDDKIEQEDQQDIPFIHNLYGLGNKQIDLSIKQQKKQQQPQKLDIKIKKQRNNDRKYTELLQRQMSDKVKSQLNQLEYLS